MNTKTKVLIGDDTVDFGITTASALRNCGMYAFTRRKDGNVLYNTILEEHPDVVLIDTVMPHMDAIELIKRVRAASQENGFRFPAFIVTSGYDNPFVERQIMELGAKYYMIRPFDVGILAQRIRDLAGKGNASSRDTSVEIKVTEIIHQLGVPAHIKGYHYLRDAILASLENHELLDSVTKLLYPTVAQHFKTTPSRVERAIRHAIEIAWDRGDLEMLNSFFGYTINTCRGKPTNSEFIALITDKLRLQLMSEGRTTEHSM